jgi:hypothetical protein
MRKSSKKPLTKWCEALDPLEFISPSNLLINPFRPGESGSFRVEYLENPGVQSSIRTAAGLEVGMEGFEKGKFAWHGETS